MLASLGACTKDNPEYCESSKDCTDPAKGICHVVLHGCYAGCTNNGDCALDSYKCDIPNKTCVPRTGSDQGPDGDGGIDQGPVPDGGLDLGATCSDDNECASTHCTDGRCCTIDSCGPCKTCTAANGTCENVTGDEPHDNDCPGDIACNAHQCINGTCAYLDAGDECKRECDTAAEGGQLDIHTCNATGICSPTPTTEKECRYTACAGTPPDCSGFCTQQSDCPSNSVCDRSQAHAEGAGRCINPSNVRVVSTDNLSAEINAALLEGKTHLRIPKRGTTPDYTVNHTFDNKTLTLVADGEVLIWKAVVGPIFSVINGGALTLQGLDIQEASGPSGHAVQCATGGTLTVVESTLASNAQHGIEADACNVAVRRSTLRNNDAGGLLFSSGQTKDITVTNTLFHDNGTGSSFFGAVSIESASSVTFVNNTLTLNESMAGGTAGIACPSIGVTNVVNAIVYDNTRGEPSSGCTLLSCTTTDPGFDAFVPQNDQAVDQGDDTAAAGLLLDHDNNPRFVGVIDTGCYEKQN